MSTVLEINKKLKSHLEIDLLECWLRHNQKDIQKEVAAEVDKEQALINQKKAIRKDQEFIRIKNQSEWKKKNDIDYNDWKKNNPSKSYALNPYYSHKTPFDTPTPSVNETIDKQGIERIITLKYKRLFSDEQWPTIEKGLDAPLNKVTTPIYEKLYERHPWYLREAGQSLAQTSLLALMKQHLYTLLPQPFNTDSTNWTWNNNIKDTFGNKSLWSPMAETVATNAIEGFPLAQVPKDFTGLHGYICLNNNIGDKKSPIESYTLNRIDVFSLLSNKYKSLLTATLITNVATTKIAPFDHSELDKINSQRRAYLQTMLINVGTETDSEWLLFHKTNEQWIAYRPKTLSQTATTNLSTLKKTLEFNEHIVDYKNNDQKSSAEKLTDNLKWQAVLFSRVLPWCIKTPPSISLEKYRSDTPISLFIEDTLRSAWVDRHWNPEGINPALAYRKPFTDGSSIDYYRSSTQTKIANGISDYNKDLLEAFDNEYLTLSTNTQNTGFDTLNINNKSKEVLVKALYVIYHQQELDRLVLPRVITSDLIGTLFDKNTSLFSVIPTSEDNLKKSNEATLIGMLTAARNRFLHTSVSAHEWTRLQTVESKNRDDLWKTTGREIAQFFQSKAQVIDLDFIDRAIALNTKWKKTFCDNSFKSEATPLEYWQALQIAQMGTKGLDELLNYVNITHIRVWDDKYKENPPNLHAVFDLNGSLNDEPIDYVKHLRGIINNLSNNTRQCTPIFKSLAFIMPKVMAENINSEIAEIFKTLSGTKKRLKDAVAEISLYDLDIESALASDLLDRLENQGNKDDLRIVVRIPAWDRASYEKPELCKTKARYRAIQNKTLDNQRLASLKEVNEQTKNIYKVATGALDPEDIIQEKRVAQQIPWTGDDVKYPLSGTIQVQQQMQQEVTQGVNNNYTQEQEEEEEEQQEQEVMQYSGDEGLLITRGNIDEKCAEMWNKIPDNVKQLSGKGDNNLGHLFSLWVGSHCDAEHVIKKIEPAAIQKIMEHASQFRLGVNKDQFLKSKDRSLPPGFRLCISKGDKGLVLCYNERLEKDHLIKRNQQALSEQNPFTLLLHKPMEPNVFRGDYRQFEPLTANKSVKEKQLLWKYLAIEDQDGKRFTEQSTLLEQLKLTEIPTAENQSVVTQQYTTQYLPLNLNLGDHKKCLEQLQEWSKGLNLKVTNALFDPENKLALSEQNLKAFGQLFYEHDAEKPVKLKNASEQFLFLANQVYTNFGEEHFTIWKNRILDPSTNLNECLVKKEIDAVAMSIHTIKPLKNPVFEKVWWKLVDAHGKSTGHMNYAPLWNSYEKVIAYLNKEKVKQAFNEESIIKYLDKADDFNGQVFLDRLLFVLMKREKQTDNVNVQSDILKNIDNIDWKHNGLYYAMRYENYPFWDSSLELTEFKSVLDANKPSYIPGLDAYEKYTQEQTRHQCLRFLSQRKHPSKEEFDVFKSLINSNVINDTINKNPNTPLVLRLLTACLTQGSDSLISINPEAVRAQIKQLLVADTKMLKWLNSVIKIDGELKPGSLQLKFEHIHQLIEAITQADLQARVQYDIRAEDNLKFVNSCGRALQCYGSEVMKEVLNGDSPVGALAKTLRKGYPGERVLHTFPWLYRDDSDDIENILHQEAFKNDTYTIYYLRSELAFLEKQLQTIDFTSSLYLPTKKELEDIDKIIRTDNNPASQRKTFIQSQINNGCRIILQDASYRPLKTDELLVATEFWKHLIPNYRENNTILGDKFLSECVAVEVAGTGQIDQLKKLLEKLKEIDNKVYHNELGQVFGLLFAKAKQDGKRYSLIQLTTMLDAFINPETIENEHFPADLLREVLDRETSKSESHFVSKNLNSLSNKMDANVERRIRAIVRSDLPAQYKSVQVKYLMHYPDDFEFVELIKNCFENLHKSKCSAARLKALCGFIESLSQTDPTNEIYEHRRFTLKRASSAFENTELHGSYPSLLIQNESIDFSQVKKVWDASYKFYTELLSNNLNQDDDILFSLIDIFHGEDKDNTVKLSSESGQLVTMILLLALENQLHSRHSNEPSKKEIKLLESIGIQLYSFDTKNLAKLACYFNSRPIPNLETIKELLEQTKSVDEFIHTFETVNQGINEKGEPKRHYSVSEQENKDLVRVISDLKRKGSGSKAGAIPDQEKKQLVNLLYYMNAYSQVEDLSQQTFASLKQELHHARNTLKSHPNDEYAKAQMLACMREVMLRKTGMWPNHTQMIVLLYAAPHNDEGLLHQVRTGQGKSILTAMRAAYLALNGYDVDVFSAKESLSERDHMEFKHVYDALGVRNGYITPHSKREAYQTKGTDGIGALNFATIGNASLFFANHIWKQGDTIPLFGKKRAAFIDEVDHVLNDEDTQFNYSDTGGGAETAYNYEEWVYRTTYEFYLKNKDSFKLENSIPVVSRNTELKNLADALKKQARTCPPDSKFFETYIAPVLDKKEGAEHALDLKLKQLLFAAHSAHHLKEGIGFSITREQRVMPGGTLIDTSFAKVLIGNQIKQGSTYSEGVQQLLHARLNYEKIAKGEAPDFFIEPDSSIACSSNAKYMLENYYTKLEGCSGTLGDQIDMKGYKKNFDIDHVIKAPSHEESKTEFLKTEYSDTKDKQIESIVEKLVKYTDRPILVTCEDDIEVKYYAEKIRKSLKDHPDISKNLIVDTNDSGKTENEVVPLSGKMGTITLSSRMGRGTDIKPQSEEGLMVIRTYPNIVRKTKQELGRQGRNGKKGTVIDLFDYSQIEKESGHLLKGPDAKDFQKLVEQNQKLIHEKIAKATKSKITKYTHFVDNEELQTKFSITRALEQFKYAQKKKNQRFMRQKEALLASLTGDIVKFLNDSHKDAFFTDKQREQFQKRWNSTRADIEDKWNNRLANEKSDSLEIYNKRFIDKASEIWESLSSEHSALDSELCKKNKLTDKDLAIVSVDSEEDLDLSEAFEFLFKGRIAPKTDPHLNKIVDFYQKWVSGAQTHYFGDPAINDEMRKAIYTPWKNSSRSPGLLDLYKQIFTISLNNGPLADEKIRDQFFTMLSASKQPQLFLVSTTDLARQLGIMTSKENIAKEKFSEYLTYFKDFFDAPAFKKDKPTNVKPEDIKKYGLLFDLAMSIAQTKITEDSTPPARSTKALIQNLSKVIREKYWDGFNEKFAANMKELYAKNADTTELLSATILDRDLHEIVGLVQHATLNKSDRIPELVSYFAKHKKELLEGDLEQVRPYIQHVLKGAHKDTKDYILPENPKHIDELNNTQRGKLMHFISQRMPVTDTEYHDLIKYLTENIKDNRKNFNKFILDPMISLPPYISIQYILRQLEGKDSRSNPAEILKVIEHIKESGNKFNKFALNHDLIGSDTIFQQNQNHNVYAQLQEEFNKMSPSKNEDFFGNCLNKSLPLGAAYIIASAWSSNKMTDHNDLVALISNVDKLKRLSTKDEHINQVLSEWQNSNYDINKVNASIGVLKKAASLQQNFPEIVEQYNNEAEKDTDTINKYTSFITSMQDTDFNEATRKGLFDAYFTNNKIKSKDELDDAISVIKTAQKLEKSKNWNDYFSSQFCKRHKERQSIMSLLVNSILDLGTAFANKCYEEYTKLAMRVIRVPDVGGLSAEERRKVLSSNYRKVADFGRELADIGKDADNSDKKLTEMSHAGFFNSKQKEYQSVWWKNSTRREQAKTMFKKLDDITDSTTEVDRNYFNKILRTITESQKAILESDKGTRRNTKGYSRLYDITVQMTLQICKDYIETPQISAQDGTFLNDLMSDQMDYQIQLLKERLPASCSKLKTLLAEYNKGVMHEGSTDLPLFIEKLKKADWNKVPYNLTYLVTNINGFIDLRNEDVISDQVTNKR